MQGFKGLNDHDSDVEITSDEVPDNEFVAAEELDDDADDDDEDEEEDEIDTSSSTDDEDEEELSPEDLQLDRSDDEEDEVVKAIKAEKEKPRVHPPDFNCENDIVDISFHPGSNILAAGLITGDVLVIDYTNEETIVKETLELHKKACRDIEFNQDGSVLYSCSKDKCIMLTDTSTGKLVNFYENSHEEPLFSLNVIDENLFSTGDDGGTVKLWDARQKKSILSVKYMEDYVSDMKTNSDKKYLVCTSGDGSLTTIDLFTRKLHVQSEPYEAELLCMGLFRRDSRILIGSSKGTLYLYNWGQFGLHTDLFSSSKESITSLVPITEYMAAISDNDGFIRAVNIYPNRFLGVIGHHDAPVTSLDISHDGQFLASCSDDQKIKFWNIKYFEDLDVEERTRVNKRQSLQHNLPSSKLTNASDFFSGLT